MRRSTVELSPVRPGPVTVGSIVDFIQRECVLPESRQSMTLHPYQLDLVEAWHDSSTTCDIAVIAAGNAKTTTLGAYVTAHLFLDEEANVPVVAETITQAVLTTWGKVKRFVELNPKLAERAEVLEGQGTRRGVYVPGMGSHCFPIASKPAGLQGLNPSRAVLEEVSEHSVDTFGALMNRLGKREASPAGAKLIGITTPSFTPDNALLHVQRAVHGEAEAIEGVRLTEYISDQKDHRDERQWHQASPGLPFGMPGIGAIRADLALLPEQQFRAYRLCQQPKGSKSCWLNSLDDNDQETGDGYEVWMRGEQAHTFREGGPVFAGVDVAKSRDHAAVVHGQFRDDGRLHVACRVWTPTTDADIDLAEIADHLTMLAGRYDLKAVWFDPSYFYNAPQLERDGLPMVSVPPTEQRMAPVCGAAYQAIRRTRVTHNGDETLTLHVTNARRRYCNRGFVLEKPAFGSKIDACIALVLCWAAANDLSTIDHPIEDFLAGI
ncbi:MAG TPA: terminase TerL endonuclease subunit [Ilumatobacter sp.]|nr:terminase TerL endonuclease subunit [Ilumatobacter sp.]